VISLVDLAKPMIDLHGSGDLVVTPYPEERKKSILAIIILATTCSVQPVAGSPADHSAIPYKAPWPITVKTFAVMPDFCPPLAGQPHLFRQHLPLACQHCGHE
jgi:hypothetical protein